MLTLGAAAPSAASRPRPSARSAWAVMRAVGFALFLRETKTRFGGQWWGVVWSVGEPLAQSALLLLIYGVLRAHEVAGVDTLLFLVTGILPFQLFKSLVLRLMEGIEANQGLFAYRQVRPVDALLARAAVEVLIAVLMGAALVAGLLWLGHPVWPEHPLELMALSALLVAFGMALGLMVAVTTTGGLTRLRAVVRMAFFPLFLSSGAMFPIAALPEAAQAWFLANPLTHLLEGLRAAFFGARYRSVPDAHWGLPAACALGLAVLGLAVYRARGERLKGD